MYMFAGSKCPCEKYAGIVSRSAFTSGMGMLATGTAFGLSIGKSIFYMDIKIPIGCVYMRLAVYVSCECSWFFFEHFVLNS